MAGSRNCGSASCWKPSWTGRWTRRWPGCGAPHREITHIEVGAGGYAPHPHCDVAALLASASARSAWLDGIARHGLGISALNAWGNPLHPDAELARRHDEDLRNAIRLAAALGVTRVVAMAGCPAGPAGGPGAAFRRGRLAAVPGGRLRAAVGAADRAVLGRPGRLRGRGASRPAGLPGTAPGHVRVQRRDVRAGWPRSGPRSAPTSTPATSSGWAWTATGSPPRSAARVGHVHGKDTVFHADSLALNGLLDRRWPEPAADMPWTFAVPGRGHDLAWWAGLVRALSRSQAQVVSIEHEDPFVPAETGVPEAARLLRAAIDARAGAWRGDRPPAAGRPGGHRAHRPGDAPALPRRARRPLRGRGGVRHRRATAPGRAPSATASPPCSPTGAS